MSYLIRASDVTTSNNTVSIGKLLQLVMSDEWFSINCFSFLCISDLAILDSAFTTRSCRNIWLNTPKRLSSVEVLIEQKQHIHWCKSRNISITSLSMNDSHSTITDRELLNLSEHSESLTQLKCKYLWLASPLGITGLMKKCHSLQQLDFQLSSKILITDKLLCDIGLYCKDLTSFKIMSSNSVTDKGFEALLNGCTILQHFEFINDDRYDSKSSHGNDISDDGINFNTFNLIQLLDFVPASQLESLCLKQVHFSSSPSSVINNNRSMCCIRSLELSFVTGVTDAMLEYIGANLSLLEVFKLELIPTDTDMISTYSASYHDKSNQVSNKGIRAIVKGCRYLTAFEVADSSDGADMSLITDDAFYTISYYCSHLQHLKINNTKITNNTLYEIGKLNNISSGLRSIDVYNNPLVNDEGILQLVGGGRAPLSSSASVEHIVLDIDGVNITNKALHQIADYCPLLLSITILYDEQQQHQQLLHHHNNNDNDDEFIQSIDYLLHHCPLLQSIEGTLPIVLSDEVEKELLHRQRHFQQQQQQGSAANVMMNHDESNSNSDNDTNGVDDSFDYDDGWR